MSPIGIDIIAARIGMAVIPWSGRDFVDQLVVTKCRQEEPSLAFYEISCSKVVELFFRKRLGLTQEKKSMLI